MAGRKVFPDAVIYDFDPYSVWPYQWPMVPAKARIQRPMMVQADPVTELQGYRMVPSKSRYTAILGAEVVEEGGVPSEADSTPRIGAGLAGGMIGMIAGITILANVVSPRGKAASDLTGGIGAIGGAIGGWILGRMIFDATMGD